MHASYHFGPPQGACKARHSHGRGQPACHRVPPWCPSGPAGLLVAARPTPRGSRSSGGSRARALCSGSVGRQGCARIFFTAPSAPAETRGKLVAPNDDSRTRSNSCRTVRSVHSLGMEVVVTFGRWWRQHVFDHGPAHPAHRRRRRHADRPRALDPRRKRRPSHRRGASRYRDRSRPQGFGPRRVHDLHRAGMHCRGARWTRVGGRHPRTPR